MLPLEFGYLLKGADEFFWKISWTDMQLFFLLSMHDQSINNGFFWTPGCAEDDLILEVVILIAMDNEDTVMLT